MAKFLTGILTDLMKEKHAFMGSILLSAALLALPIAVVEAQDATYEIFVVAGGPCEVNVHHGAAYIPPVKTSNSRFLVAMQGALNERPIIRVGRVSAEWTTKEPTGVDENGEYIFTVRHYELDIYIKTREETLIQYVHESTSPGSYFISLIIAGLDVDGTIKVNGETYTLSKPDSDLGTLILSMQRDPAYSMHSITLNLGWPETGIIGSQFYVTLDWSTDMQSSPCIVQIH